LSGKQTKQPEDAMPRIVRAQLVVDLSYEVPEGQGRLTTNAQIETALRDVVDNAFLNGTLSNDSEMSVTDYQPKVKIFGGV
jgi:hypothetical protein